MEMFKSKIKIQSKQIKVPEKRKRKNTSGKIYNPRY
jgi:hypothetical protein